MKSTAPDFIYKEYVSKPVCKYLIKFFKKSSDKAPGVVGGGKIIPEIKTSVDIGLDVLNPVLQPYLKEVAKILEKYKRLYRFCDRNHGTYRLQERISLQCYAPGQAYFSWHPDRCGKKIGEGGDRHLSFMTYLNNVKQGGKTEWFYQKVAVSPKEGLTIIWPVGWTHTHRGTIAPRETKYIITGWYNFV